MVVEGCAELVKRIGCEVMRFACRDAGTSRSAGMRVSDPAAIRANFITGMLPIRTGLTSEGLAGRDRDVLAVGWAQSYTRGSEFDKPYEGALESYYRARVTSWLHLSPHFQYIINPGSSGVDDAFTAGVRAQVTF